jgi:hypothetical protein
VPESVVWLDLTYFCCNVTKSTFNLFYRDQLLPGIAAVVPRPPERLAPLALSSWFVTPTVDLVLHDQAMSPRDWLIAGGDPAVVAALAAEL